MKASALSKRLNLLITGGLIVLALIGLALADFAPDKARWYWIAVMVPAGALAAATLARYNRSKHDGWRRQILHWVVILAGMLFVFMMVNTGTLSSGAAGPVLMLILALGVTLAGLGLSRAFIATGFYLLFALAAAILLGEALLAGLGLAVLALIGFLVWEKLIKPRMAGGGKAPPPA